MQTLTPRRSATINAVIKCTQCWSLLFLAAHYIEALQSAHIFDTSSEYALKQIRHNCIDVGTSIIKRVRKVYVSERMRVCPRVGGRKWNVECGVVRWGPIG